MQDLLRQLEDIKQVYRSQVRWVFESPLRVRRFIGDAAGTNREEIRDLSEFSEVRRRDHRRFAEITEKARLLVDFATRSGASWESVERNPRAYRKSVGRSPESSPEQDLKFVG